MMRLILITLLLCFSYTSYAKHSVLNLYSWTDDIPQSVVSNFETETGIQVNHLSYNSNEVMLAKLQSSHKIQFDIIEPSNFFLDQLKARHLIEPLNTKLLKGLDNIPSHFKQSKKHLYGLPYFYGSTGIILNKRFHKRANIRYWRDFWQASLKDSLLLLNEPREVFSIALLSMHEDPNSTNPTTIKKAYNLLLGLFPNIKIFNSDAHVTLYIDEDINIGMIWNVDAARAIRENPELEFYYPEDGFVVYIDNFSILHKAPHRENAYRFLNYLLRPDVAAKISEATGYAVTNQRARTLLSANIRDNNIIYPPDRILKNSHLQKAVPLEVMKYYEHYWQKLKLSH